METILRISSALILNGFLTAILWAIAIYLYFLLTGTQMDGFLGGRIGIVILGIMGAVIGCIIGFAIGLLNTPALKSAFIGGLVCLVIGMTLVIMDLINKTPSGLEMIWKMIFILIPTVLAAIASGITAKLFNGAIR